MREPKQDVKLLDALGKAIGLLDGTSGNLQLDWFGNIADRIKALPDAGRREHLLDAIASLLGDPDLRGRKADEAPWWYRVASRAPAAGTVERRHVPIDLVLGDSAEAGAATRGLPILGVGARYQAKVDPDKLNVLLWIRAWLLGLRAQAVPFVQPLDAAMRPQLVGDVTLGIPAKTPPLFLSSIGLAGGLWLPAPGQGVAVDATLTLAPWKPRVSGAPDSAPRVAGDKTPFRIKIGDGSPAKASIAAGLKLTAFLARTFLEHKAAPGNLAERLVQHLFPLVDGSAPIKIAFPLDGLVDGGAGALEPWAKQFVPVPSLALNADAPAAALIHLWGLVRPNPPAGSQPAITSSSRAAWLAGDPADGFALQIDHQLDPTAGAVGVVLGVLGSKRVANANASPVRCTLGVRATLGGVKLGAAPALIGPHLAVTLAFDPATPGTPLLAANLPGAPVSAAVERAKLTLTWAGGVPAVAWWFDTTSTGSRSALAAHVVAQVAAAIPPEVKTYLAAAQQASTAPNLWSALGALAPAVTATVDGVAYRAAVTAAGITFTAGNAIAMSVTPAGAPSIAATLPVPLPAGLPLALALKVSGSAAKLDVALAVTAGGGTVELSLRPDTLDPAYLATLIKQLVVPVATAAVADAGAALLELEVAPALGGVPAIKLGQIFAWAGLLKEPAGAASWAMRSVTELANRGALLVVAEVASKLAELKAAAGAGLTIDDLRIAPVVDTSVAGTTAVGVALAHAPPTTPPSDVTLLEAGAVRFGIQTLAAKGLALTGSTVTFAPQVKATGLFVQAGGPGAPLLDDPNLGVESARLTAGVTIGGADGFKLDAVGVKLTKLRLPLGTNGGLASGLLGKKPSDNPGISVGFTWTNPGVAIAIEGATPVWTQVGLQIGPLSLDRIGVDARPAAKPTHLHILFDGGFALGPLAIRATGLNVGFEPKDLGRPDRWKFGLDGLGISLAAGPVSLAGFLQRVELPPPAAPGTEEFRGAALIKIGSFQISAIGAYRDLGGMPSLFVFGALNAPLGGPPFFFVTGVAGGFGINRALVIPDDPEQLKQHAFFQIMQGDPAALADVGALGAKIAAQFGAERGTSWFAAGVRFTSFSLIHGIAVLYVRFGREFELGIAARATLDLEPIASVTLVLKGAFVAGDDPRLTIRADLVDSWVFSEKCRLTGTFFFGLWPKRGDCLLTLGGFHKDYKVPDHYPKGLSRLGFSWAIGDTIKAEGSVYFALTPREAMGGALLKVAGQWGPLAAGFDAWFDAWIGWDPFWFDLEIGVRVWVSVFGVRASLGVSLRIWGPPVGGVATIEVFVWEFSIPFGEDRTTKSDPLPAGKFVSQHLKLRLSAEQEKLRSGLVLPARTLAENTGGNDEGPDAQGLIEVRVTTGAMPPPAGGKAKLPDGSADRPFRIAPEFVLEVRSRVPVTTAIYMGNDVTVPLTTNETLSFAPCNLGLMKSLLALAHGAAVASATARNPAVTLLAPEPMPRALFGAWIAGPGKVDAAGTTIPQRAGVRLDGRARLGRSAGIVTFTLERSETAIPMAWGQVAASTAVAPRLGSPEAAEREAPVREARIDEAPVREARIDEAPVREARIDEEAARAPRFREEVLREVRIDERTVVAARITPAAPVIGARDTTIGRIEGATALREVAVAPLRARSTGLAAILLRDLTPWRAGPEVAAIRTGTLAGERLRADTEALRGDGVRVVAGEWIVLHDVAPDAVLHARGDQALQVVCIGGFGAPLARVHLGADRDTLALPAGTQRVLVRGLGRDAPASGDARAVGFDARTALVRVGDRAWWGRDAMVGLVGGEPPAGQPPLAPAAEVLRDGRAVRLWFAPTAAAATQIDPHAIDAEPDRIAIVVTAGDDLEAAARAVRWTGLEAPLDQPKLIDGDGVAIWLWRCPVAGAMTVTGELEGDGRVVAAVRVPAAARALLERLRAGSPELFTDDAFGAGTSWLQIAGGSS